jgi:uncharacterized membrane protein
VAQFERKFDQFIRFALVAILPISSLLVACALAVEFVKAKETVPASLFIVLLSLCGVCMAWARVEVISRLEQEQVYLAGVHVFLGSMLALASLPLVWFAQNFKSTLNVLFYDVLVGAHVLFLVLSLILGCRAVVRLLRVVNRTGQEPQKTADS